MEDTGKPILTKAHRAFLRELKAAKMMIVQATSSRMTLTQDLHAHELAGFSPAPEHGTFAWRIYPTKAPRKTR